MFFRGYLLQDEAEHSDTHSEDAARHLQSSGTIVRGGGSDARALALAAAPVSAAVANPVSMAVSDEEPVAVRLAGVAVTEAVPRVVVLP